MVINTNPVPVFEPFTVGTQLTEATATAAFPVRSPLYCGPETRSRPRQLIQSVVSANTFHHGGGNFLRPGSHGA